LSGFANPKMADFIDAQIEDGLKTPGAEDVTAPYRQGPRKVEFEGRHLPAARPSCAAIRSQHPLANREFLCPYASVVEVPQAEMLARIGYTLACSAITRDPAVHLAARGLPGHRPIEHRPGVHDEDLLGPTARGQHVRVPLEASLDRARLVSSSFCSPSPRQGGTAQCHRDPPVPH
jgi:hypothetical protein